MSPKQILVIPHLKVNNANAWSSPYTAGFPSISSIGGSIHALQRKLNEAELPDLKISKFGVISHRFSMRTYRESIFSDQCIVANANPLDKDGGRPAFVPEIKCRMEISLICEITNYPLDKSELIRTAVSTIINNGFRIAAGDVLSFHEPFLANVGTEDKDQDFNRYIIRVLMPGYALIERRNLMIEMMEDGKDALDSLIDHLSIETRLNPTNGKFERKRKIEGWIVPISTGYAAISDIGHALNQRDDNTPHRFAEAVVTLGEFKMLHRIQNINCLLWESFYNENEGLYCYRQNLHELDEVENDFDFTQL